MAALRPALNFNALYIFCKYLCIQNYKKWLHDFNV